MLPVDLYPVALYKHEELEKEFKIDMISQTGNRAVPKISDKIRCK